jgi:serine/threonine protein kinase
MKLTEKTKLGEGEYAAVYKVMTKDKQTAYAVKIFNFPFELMSVLKPLNAGPQLKILQQTSHPFIVR